MKDYPRLGLDLQIESIFRCIKAEEYTILSLCFLAFPRWQQAARRTEFDLSNFFSSRVRVQEAAPRKLLVEI